MSNICRRCGEIKPNKDDKQMCVPDCRVKLSDILNNSDKHIDDDPHYLNIGVGAIDLDRYKVLIIDAENILNKKQSELVKNFIIENKHYVYFQPYEGYQTIFISEKPDIIKVSDVTGLHRGATGIINNCPRNLLVILDLD